MTGLHMKNNGYPGLISQPVAPSDAANLPAPGSARRLYVGTTGDVALLLDEDADNAAARVFKSVPAGTMLDLAVKKVFATATTATDMIAIY